VIAQAAPVLGPETARPSHRHRLYVQARFVLALALVVLGLLFWTRGGFQVPPNTITAGPVPLALLMGDALAYAGVGLLLALRRPEVRIGAIQAWIGVLIAALTMAWGFLAMESQLGNPSSLGPWIALGAAVIVTPSIVALVIGLALLYPSDHLLAPGWRSAVWLASAGVALAAVGRLFKPGELTFVGDYQNPLGVTALGDLFGLVQALGYLLLGIAGLLAVVSLVTRYVNSDVVERAQLRIFAALTVAGAVALGAFVATFFFPSLDASVRAGVVVVLIVIAGLGPIAVMVAIARYRLWEIDRLVERTFVYGALTAILAGLYAATIRLLEALFVVLTGQSSDAALIIATLVLATTFTPVKSRLEHLADSWTKERAKALTAEQLAAGADVDAPTVALSNELAEGIGGLSSEQLVTLIDQRIRIILDERAGQVEEADQA
jgi:hypothetical protein